MKRKTKSFIVKLIMFILIGSFVYYIREDITSFALFENNEEKIKIANWNLQIFGEKKASDTQLLNSYLDIIDNYDIVFIQEIRDSSGESFKKLCSALSEYNCINSSRAGRSTSKEQIGIIYKKSIEITQFKDLNPDEQDRWERPPVKISFKIKDYEFTTYNIHVKPDDVEDELSNLKEIVSNEGNVIILGDLNADCSYYDNEKNSDFEEWHWLIKDDEDTTVGNSGCAYDRIIINSDAKKEFSSYGIEKNVTKEMSDHYLVWVEIKTN